ncbi:hypothetical protein SPV1_04848 [Mariprofundus ferrooxydans PV-1]|jgi:hypothetical protein|uniref:Uncharacterized protein n=1 Tax=Mariprofundus ferrooxydans PV-1 TaxID=314345 RepID=Q0F321_9PROT|nr:hypothetical protein SPV1_04848 [Mariprofundus ferrooxydans PV-1]
MLDDSVLEQHGEKKGHADWAYNGEFGYRPLFMFMRRNQLPRASARNTHAQQWL